MAEKERLGRASAKSLKVGGVAVPKTAAGQVSVTGSGTIAAPPGFAAITSVVACLGQAGVVGADKVSATWSGLTVTFAVETSTDSASGTACVVNYIITGT